MELPADVQLWNLTNGGLYASFTTIVVWPTVTSSNKAIFTNKQFGIHWNFVFETGVVSIVRFATTTTFNRSTIIFRFRLQQSFVTNARKTLSFRRRWFLRCIQWEILSSTLWASHALVNFVVYMIKQIGFESDREYVISSAVYQSTNVIIVDLTIRWIDELFEIEDGE